MKKIITICLLILMISLVGCTTTKLYQVRTEAIKENMTCSEFCKFGKDLGNNLISKGGVVECGWCVCYDEDINKCDKPCKDCCS